MWKLLFLCTLFSVSALGAKVRSSVNLYPNPGLDNTFALSSLGGIFVGGMTLDPNPQVAPEVWVARIRGKKLARVRLEGLEHVHVVTMKPHRGGWYVLGVMPPPKFETSILSFSAKGKLLKKWSIENTVSDRPSGLAITKQGILIYGTTVKMDKTRDGWLLLVKDGKKVWERKVDRGRDEAFLQVIPEEKGHVVVGDSGKLNRFGQGPSRLWVMRVDLNGDSTGEVFVEGGRLNSRGQPLAAVWKGDIFVSFTETELPPPRKGVPPDFEFDSQVVRISPKFQVLWKKKLGATTDAGTAMLLSNRGKILLAGSGNNSVWTKRIDVNGKIEKEASAPVKGRLNMVDFMAKGSQLLGLGQVMRFPSADLVQAKKAPAVEQDFFFFRFIF